MMFWNVREQFIADLQVGGKAFKCILKTKPRVVTMAPLLTIQSSTAQRPSCEHASSRHVRTSEFLRYEVRSSPVECDGRVSTQPSHAQAISLGGNLANCKPVDLLLRLRDVAAKMIRRQCKKDSNCY